MAERAERIDFSAQINFGEVSEQGKFEGILVNYNAKKLAHGMFKFAKGSLKKSEGKTLFVLYNHEKNSIPVGTMTGTEKEDGFYIQGQLDLSQDAGGYINKDAAKLYNLMKNGANFELSVGGFLTNYTEKKEDSKSFYEITEFDAYEGSITPRGAVEGSRITKVFNNLGGEKNMTREEMQLMLKEFTAEIMKAKTDEELKALPAKFTELEKTFAEIKADFSKEVLQGFETKFNEINDVIKGLKAGFTATAEEISDAQQFAAMLDTISGNGVKVATTFNANEEITFGEIATTDGSGSNQNLGKTVKPTYATKILERIQARNPILKDVNFINISDGSLQIPREMLGLPTTGWVGEVDSRDETTVTKVDSVTINLFQLYAMPVISNKLLATNFVGYANFLLRRVEYALSLTLANAVLNGSGTNQPKGILKDSTVIAGKKELDLTDDTTLVDSIIDAYYSVPDEIAKNAKWYMRRETWARIAKVKNERKDFYITDLNTGNERKLMTRPVEIVEDENSGLKDIVKATATTDPVALFSDLGMAVQGITNNKLDLRIEDKLTQKGVTKYYMEKLVGVEVQLPEYAVMLVKKA